MRFTAAVTHEDGWYVARCLEVEVTSQGASVEEALANLDTALLEGIEPPIIATVGVRPASARWARPRVAAGSSVRG